MDSNTEPYKYWAFISYSHRDERWGKWLHRALESRRIPASLVGQAGALGTIPKRLYPVWASRCAKPCGPRAH